MKGAILDEHAQISRRSARGRPFAPGVSGNPGGRPRGFASYIREQTGEGRELVDFALGVLRDDTAPGRSRLDALRWLADRGFGRVPELGAVADSGAEYDTFTVTDADLARFDELEAELKRRRAA